VANARSRRRALLAVLAAVILSVMLIVNGGVVQGLKATGRAIVSPFTWTINLVAHPVSHLFAGAVNYSDVLRQNEQLRAELGRERLMANEDSALRRQLAQISATEHLSYVGSLDSVVAQVTSNSPTNFSSSVTVNRGSDDGLLVGMPVVGNGGLIGRVVATTTESATVLLITDQTSIVGVSFGNGRHHALVLGHGVNDPLAASAVQITSPLSPGAIFATDGLEGGLFPPGIPVAKVRTITLTPGTSTYELTLSPAADLTHLSYVNVLIWEPAT
jgi:rod shape-determining protein MreC